jgi:hypothetical protein
MLLALFDLENQRARAWTEEEWSCFALGV